MVLFIVRHGDNKETLFNADCMVASLVDNIKHRCGLVKSMSIALCDADGCIHQLEENQKGYANKFMKEREKYVLVRIEKSDENGIKYTCLLDGLHKTDPELLRMIEGKLVEDDESSQLPNLEAVEQKRSSKSFEKRLSVPLATKRKSRAVNKIS